MVYCSHCSKLKVPYYCPYCDQTSTRKWNLSTHIKRKHHGSDDPFEIPNKIVLGDPYYQPRGHNSDFSNYFLPQIDFSDPLRVSEKMAKFKRLLEEIKKLSPIELMSVQSAIRDLLQFR